MGADPQTFAGLSGVGDLFLVYFYLSRLMHKTCTSEKSRNFTVGKRLSKGESLQHVIESLGSVAEGVSTTPAAFALALKLGVDAPIITAVYRVLVEGASPIEEFTRVTNRESKEEVTL